MKVIHLLFLGLLFASVSSICSPDYSLVPPNAWLTFIPNAVPKIAQLDTIWLINTVGYCTSVAYSCFSNYYHGSQSLFTLSTNKLPASEWTSANQSVAIL